MRSHPMLFAVRDLLRRELDHMDLVAPILDEQLDYMRALDSLCRSLHDHEQAEALFTPGFTIERDGTYRDGGGLAVKGWYHVLRLPDGQEIHPREEVAFHYYRWRAKLAARSWMKRARTVSQRIATELESLTAETKPC